MKICKWPLRYIVGMIACNLFISPYSHVLAKESALAKVEQGEEEYHPAKTETTNEDNSVKTSSPIKQETNNNSATKDELKQKKNQEPSDKDTFYNEKMIEGEKSSHEGNNEDKAHKDKEEKLDDNKLTDVDEKVVETKNYNGILWFIGVFVTLLIVIFAFT